MGGEIERKVFEEYKDEILKMYEDNLEDNLDPNLVWKNIMHRFFGDKIDVSDVLDNIIYGDFLGEKVSDFMEVLGGLNREK